MKTSMIRAALIASLAGLFVASVGMASAGSLGYFGTPTAQKAAAKRHSAEAKPAACPLDEEDTAGEAAAMKKCRAPEEGDETVLPEPPADETVLPDPPGDTVSREAECRAAAGMSTGEDGGEGSEPTVAGDTAEATKKKGLDHAIEVVLANCIKNPQAPGLVNALRHLAENRDRHAAHEAEKALRRAGREARKPAGHGPGGHGKGHGRPAG